MPQTTVPRCAVSGDKPTRTLLVLSQVYPPDPASVGQHVAGARCSTARMLLDRYHFGTCASVLGVDAVRCQAPAPARSG